MSDIRSAAKFSKWISGKPVSWPGLLSARCAFRAFPYWELPNSDKEVALTFRALLFSRAGSVYSDKEIRAAAREAAGMLIGHDVPGTAFAAMASAHAVARVDAAAAASIVSSSRALDGSEYFWDALSSDVTWLEGQPRNPRSRNDINRISTRLKMSPLWQSGPPAEFLENWSNVSKNLIQKNGEYKFWVDWFGRIIFGSKSDFGTSGLLDRAIYIELSKLNTPIWFNNLNEMTEYIIKTLNLEIKYSLSFDNELSNDRAVISLPTELPLQGHGPHYRLNDGQIVFAPKSALDVNRNDISRLKSLYPVLKTLCLQAEKIFGRNAQHADVKEIIAEYFKALSFPIEDVDFAQLAGLGLILANIEDAANREIEDRLRSEFEDNEKAVLKSLLDAHGPFILATEVGRELLADAERYRRNVEQESIYRNDGAELVEAARIEGVIRAKEADFTRNLAQDVGRGPAPERTAVFGQSALRNFSIAIIGGGAIGACAIMGKDLWDAGQPFFTFLGGGLGLTGVEALKKSKPFQETVKSLTSLLDKAGGFDGDEAEKYRKFAVLILKEEDRLRRLAGEQREYRWLHEWLDWIKANYKP